MKIRTPFKPDKVFFTSDLHLGHNNIIDYCRRYYSFKDGSRITNTEQMDNLIIETWNETIPKDATVFLLGDVVWSDSIGKWKSYVKQLNGHIYHIVGNHDKFFIQNNLTEDIIIPFKEAIDILEIKIYDEPHEKKIILCHYPILHFNGSHKANIHLYGHLHSGYEVQKHPFWNAVDVGVDTRTVNEVFNPKPYSYSEIQTRITQQFLNK